MADFAFFEVTQVDQVKQVRFRRISEPAHSNGITCFIDGDILETACVASETAKDGKITRPSVPADWALTEVGIDVSKVLNKGVYLVHFA